MDAIKKIPTSLPGLFILEPRVFGDERGFFLESYNERVMAEAGIVDRFVQDNHSCSQRNVLRGFHADRLLDKYEARVTPVPRTRSART
jgi:dTDP-4-dehydrorhamnose 3,5-epimerase